MIQRLFLVLLTSFLISCQDSPEEKIENMNGYWEIKRADLPEGISKEFRYSEIIDFIKVENFEGFRTKVKPQFDGTYLSSQDREIFQVKLENDSINLYYSTPYNSWKETVISSEEDELVILNPRGIIYTYKRFTPYSVKNGEEN